MRILFDQATPVPIRSFLKNHAVRTAAQEGWDTLRNGELLAAAESSGFEVFLTPDKNIRHQQNLEERRIAIVVIGNPQWPTLRLHVKVIVAAVDAAIPGSYVEVAIPG